MKWIVIGTPSPFREHLINGLPEKDIVGVIFESAKDAQINFEINAAFEDKIYSKFIVEQNLKLKYYHTTNVNSLYCLELIKYLTSISFESVNIMLTGANKIKRNNLDKLNAMPNIKNIINVHMGDCFQYRGLDSNLWALYHRDFNSLGISIHYVENILDAGSRILHHRIDKPDSYADLIDRQIITTTKAITSVSNIFEQTDKPIVQTNDALGRYYGFMPAQLKQHLFQRYS